MADEVEPIAEVVPINGADPNFEVITSSEEDAERREQARVDAAIRKAIEVHRVRGATKRAELYPRQLLATLADGTTGRMLAMVVQGELVPATAKEAMEIAKISDAIARANGESGKVTGSDGERVAKIDDISLIAGHLKERAERARRAAKEPASVLGGALDPADVDTDVDLDDFDFGEDRTDEAAKGYDPPIAD